MTDTTNSAYIRSTTFITILHNSEYYTALSDNPNFEKIISAVESSRFDDAIAFISVKAAVDAQPNILNNGLSFDGSQFSYNGDVINNYLTGVIIDRIKSNKDTTSITRFLENLLENPSKTAVDELYSFMEHGKLPITEDGYVLAFKKVTSGYKDIFSGENDNSIGAVVEMDRNKVNDDRTQTCSSGLHICSFDYLSHFGSSCPSNTRIMIVKANPKDVVSIPNDYNNAKSRWCRYEVVGEYFNNDSARTSHQVLNDAEFVGNTNTETEVDKTPRQHRLDMLMQLIKFDVDNIQGQKTKAACNDIIAKHRPAFVTHLQKVYGVAKKSASNYASIAKNDYNDYLTQVGIL